MGDMDAELYIAVELGTNANDQARKQERPHLTSLSGSIQTVGNAARRGKVLEVTALVVGPLAIVEGRHDPG